MATYTNHTNHKRLQEKIYKFSRLGEIILCGDFNARIGILDDYIYDPFLDYEINSAVPIDKRCSRDLQVNSYGRSLLELCIGNNLFVLNGRTMGDFLGQFTCHTYNGASVVDYVIGSHDLQSSITANLGQVFLFQVPRLIAIFVITFAILKKFVANLFRNIANLLSQLKTPHFLLKTPHFLFEAPHFLWLRQTL